MEGLEKQSQGFERRHIHRCVNLKHKIYVVLRAWHLWWLLLASAWLKYVQQNHLVRLL